MTGQTAISALITDEVARACLHSLMSGPDAIIYVKDRSSRFMMVSEATAAKHGLTQEQMIGLTDTDLFDAEHYEFALAEEEHIMATGEPTALKLVHETWLDRPDSWAEATKRPLRDATGSVIGLVGIAQDVTARVQAERTAAHALTELSAVESQLRAVLDNSPDAISRTDQSLRLSYVNPAAQRLLNRSERQLLGRALTEIGLEPGLPTPWHDEAGHVLRGGEPRELEIRIGADDDERWYHTRMTPELDADGAVHSVLSFTRDITALKLAERTLSRQALTDPVTGLANRTLLTDRLRHGLARLQRRPGHLALLFVDLDRFKEVNDQYGHHLGDQVLHEVGRRLEALARREDTVARIGGDEFVVLCETVACRDDAHLVAERVVTALTQPMELGGVVLRISASVGVIVTDSAQADPVDLLRCADAAMYRAKRGGRNGFRIWDELLDGAQSEGIVAEADLARALDRDEFELVFQPLLSLGTRQLQGFEALVRWSHPTRGRLAPAEFLGTAENCGLATKIDAWVLDHAVGRLAQWQQSAPELTMAVNVSGRQLSEPGFPAVVTQILTRHGVRAEHLVLEVPEHALLTETAHDEIRTGLDALGQLGVQLAVDNFGVGYSLLSTLPTFPVSIVKLGRPDGELRGRRVAAAIVAMAHGLGMSVIGERIETVSQLDELVALEVDGAQGFLFAPALDVAAATTLVTAQAAAVAVAVAD